MEQVCIRKLLHSGTPSFIAPYRKLCFVLFINQSFAETLQAAVCTRKLLHSGTPSFIAIYSSVGKESACNAGDLGSIPSLGRSPGGEHGNSPQNSRLENPHGQRSLWATVHGFAKSRTQWLSDQAHTPYIPFFCFLGFFFYVIKVLQKPCMEQVCPRKSFHLSMPQPALGFLWKEWC